MTTFLFNEIIFGPVFSRRLGISLGINLLPPGVKLCNFNCIYCECGLTGMAGDSYSKIPARQEVRKALESRLIEMSYYEEELDAITFAGNGEPTLHPEFHLIVDDTISLRDRYFSNAGIAVLSNASMICKDHIFNALLKVDENILKLDSGSPDKIKIINRPQSAYNLDELVECLKRFRGKLIIQSLFLQGNYLGMEVDNTTEEDLVPWLQILGHIMPQLVMVYTFSRSTPTAILQKIKLSRLNEIAARVTKLWIKVQVSG